MIGRRLAPDPVSAPAIAAGRAPFALSARGLLLLGAGLVWLVPVFVDRRAVLLMLAWDLVVLVLAVADLRSLAPPRDLVVIRRWGGPLTIGTPVRVTLSVEGPGRPARIRLGDYLPASFAAALPVVELSPAGADGGSGSYEVVPGARGDYETGPIALTWWSRWHLVERWGTAAAVQRVRVYPDLAQGRSEALYLVRSRQVALEKRRTRFAGFGREFESLRDYREGDERRDISWTATARRARLVTRVFQPERSQTVWILLDAGRLLRARIGDRTLLDASVAAAITLAQVALASGDRVGLIAYGRRVQSRIAPSRGAGHLRAIVEALATVHADGVDADHATAVAALLTSQTRRALIVWLTDVAETAGTPEVIEHAAAMTARHLVLFAVMRQPEIAALAAAVPDTPALMYRVAAAQEALERRDALLLGLRHRGALVTEVGPAELGSGVVSRYLEARDKGLM